jgi:release factor glutamine methyltransferase
MTSVGQWLEHARALGVDRLDAQLLIAHALGVSRSWLIAHDDASVEAPVIEPLLERRADGVPLAYLVGRREFHGLELRITPDVLDPRPDTETLVDWALEHLAAMPPNRYVVDLGTGSGAIALALKHGRPDAQVHATDASEPALAVARDNAARLGLEVRFAHGDWWNATPPQLRFDLALSNPPYIAAGDPHLAALRHEPRHALTPGGDGLGAIERIVEGAAGHLAPGGWLLVEHGFDQAPAVRDLLVAHGFVQVSTRADLAGVARCSGGRRPA